MATGAFNRDRIGKAVSDNGVCTGKMKRAICLIIVIKILICGIFAQNIDTQSSDSYYIRGEAYFKNKDYNKAIADFNEAIKLHNWRNTSKRETYFYLGEAYYAKKDYNRAKEVLKTIDPDDYYMRSILKDGKSYMRRGKLYFKMKEYDLAILDFNTAIYYRIGDRDPDDIPIDSLRMKEDEHHEKGTIRLVLDACFYRGIIHYWKKDYDKAIADYNEAVKMLIRLNNFKEADPITDPEAASIIYLNRGIFYFANKDYYNADIDYNEAIKLYPARAEAYFSRGKNNFYKKSYGQAIADYITGSFIFVRKHILLTISVLIILSYLLLFILRRNIFINLYKNSIKFNVNSFLNSINSLRNKKK